MTDDDLTPEQQEVRRLLAAARHDQEVPAEVAARLDRVLADLAEEPARAPRVTELATRRRRATGLLVAAAAVIAVGVGVSQFIDTGTTSEDALSADRGAALESETAGDAAAADEAQPDDDQADELDSSALTAPKDGEPVELSPQAYAEDVSELQDGVVQLATGSRGAFDALGSACRADAWGNGRFVAVRYDGVPGVLVFRRAVGDTQVADLFLCGDEEPRRSVTLPAP